MAREHWKSKLGLILAISGSAVGLGNFLRFPVQMAGNGGAAFMIPYFIAFLVLGIPVIWTELVIGRLGGRYDTGSTPGMFHIMWNKPVSKYLGILGLLAPTVILIYYCYIESWTLAFSFFSITGTYESISSNGMKDFLLGFQGIVKNQYFSSITTAYIFFLITFLINIYVLKKGISGGIERLAKIGMPILFIMAIILMIRVLSIGTPDPSKPDFNILNGLAFIWNPKLSELKNSSVWLAATGQIFFTLSIGLGAIHAYASYLKKDDDVALSGLASASTNEFVEVVLGSTIAIPVAVAFFGAEATRQIAQDGSFNLAFVVLPTVFKSLPGSMVIGFLWFFLLFIAGVTSSVSLGQPLLSFLQDSLKISHEKSVKILAIIIFVCVQPIIFFISKGYLDELDFWAGSVFPIVFAFFEIIIAGWIFGMDNVWSELNMGADLKVPSFFYYIIKYVTPLYIGAILIYWLYDKALDVFLLKGVPTENLPYVIGARIFMFALFLIFSILTYKLYKNKNLKEVK